MTAFPRSREQLLSERISSPLRQIAQRQWFVLAAVGVLRTLIAGLTVLLIVALFLGFFSGLWMPLRVLVAGTAWLCVIASAAWFLRPTLRRWTLSRAAMQVERHRPDLHERLSSAVELAGERDAHFRGSPALLAHLVRQAEADAAGVRPDQVVRSDGVVRWALALASVLLAWLVIALVPATGKTAIAGLYRAFVPWKSELPAGLERVVVKPGNVTLAQGDPLDISASMALDPGKAIVFRRLENGQQLTDEMDRDADRHFRFHLDAVQQGFQYKVGTDQDNSPWYQATVHPRPQIVGLDVHYDYPAYTHLAPRADTAREGAIEAIVNSRVTLTVHTAQPVVLDKSRLVLDEGRTEQLELPLKPLPGAQSGYQAQILVQHSGEYRIRLTNEFDLTNKDEQPRSIAAMPDEAPAVSIESPDSQVTVRPDDVVPVKFTATDDFGVAKLEAILQIDDRDPLTVPVKFRAVDPRNVTGPDFRISIADVLAAQNLNEADRITYQLKVTDNRDPDPQHGFSAKQTLKINKAEWQSFQSKIDQKLAQDLTQAIQKAIGELDRNKPRLELARNQDVKRPLEDYPKKELDQAKDELPKTSRNLSKAADSAMDTVFEDVAQKVKTVADGSVRVAGEDAAQADLSSDDGEQRRQLADKSAREIQEARDALQKLLDKQVVENERRQAEAGRDLADAARKQQEAARKMQSREVSEHNPTPQARRVQQEAMEKQQQAIQKLHQALDQAEPLRDPKAQETAQKLQDLIRKIEELQKQQSAARAQTAKHQAAEQVQEKANAVAQQQEVLNREIREAARQHQESIQRAGANPPEKDHQDEIVRELNRNHLDSAHDRMNQSTGRLRNETQRLSDLAHGRELKPDDQQRETLGKAQQKLDSADRQKDAASQAAEALRQAADKSEVPKSDDDAITKAQETAREIEHQADELGGAGAEARADAQAAQEAARASAEAASAEDAKQDLRKAADALNKGARELTEAANKNLESDRADMLAQQKQQARLAAAQAKEQADRQEQLAKALENERTELAQAQHDRQPLDQTTQQQNQLAEQTKQAQARARELSEQSGGAKNADVAHRAQSAQSSLTEAQAHAAAAARAERKANEAQQQAADSGRAQDARAAEQKADAALRQADLEQQQAQEALARAQGVLRDLPAQLAQADGEAQGEEQGRARGQDQGTPHEAGPQSAQSDHHPGNPKQLMQQAAQAAQEAAKAQEEAQQQNPDAARQAARALAQAARAMADATPGSVHEGEAGSEQAQGGQPDQSDDADSQASGMAGQSSNSKQGIALSLTGDSVLPASVRDVGITADQWAKLPPLEKKDLLNAAQQTGPPAYRQMIKDYFVRVARMQDGRAAPTK